MLPFVMVLGGVELSKQQRRPKLVRPAAATRRPTRPKPGQGGRKARAGGRGCPVATAPDNKRNRHPPRPSPEEQRVRRRAHEILF